MKKTIQCLVPGIAIVILLVCFRINGRFIPIVQAFTDISDLPCETISFAENAIDVTDTNIIEDSTQSIVDVIKTETEPEIEAEELPVENVGIEISIGNSRYDINEKFDTNEIVVYAVYSDSTKVPLNTDEYNISEVDTSTYGIKTVVVQYNGFEDSFEVEVVYTVKEVAHYDRYTTTILNLRNGPSTQFDVVTAVDTNSIVTVIGEVDNGWVKVVYNDREYFCFAKYLSSSKTNVNSNNNTVSKPTTNGPFSFSNTSSTFIVESGVKAEVVDCANKYWSMTPTWLQQRFVDSGWKIVISGTNLSARQGYSYSIAGITVPKEKTIYLDNRTRAVKRAFVHELAHFLDRSYGYVSCTDEFRAIFNAEKTRYADITGIGDGHSTSNTKEYFASVVSDIILYDSESIGDIPNTYNYVMNYMN